MTALSKSIRKAAILITALDDRAADALLEQMGDELAARVRNAILQLDDITPAEQQAVLADFLAGGPVAPPRESREEAVELDESLARQIEQEPEDAPLPAVVGNREPLVAGSNPDFLAGASGLCSRRFDFLGDVPPRAIVEVLQREQPQTVAAVIAALDAELAGHLLALLPAQVATEVLERMAWLDDVPEEVLGEIELHLRASLAPHLADAGRRDQSLGRLSAVLDSMDAAARQRMLGNLGARNTHLARQLGYQRKRETPAAAEPVVSGFRYRLESTAAPASMAYRLAGDREASGAAARGLFEFDDFVALSDDALRRVFAAADPQVALLALTGASDELLDRICRQLPAHEACELRARLRQPGSIRLRDIDAAQQTLADLARRLAEQRIIVIPGSKHFAAAA